ncbi:hypothetical protein BMS3Bbin02_01038 [bacterium BMS3Bbin02]|nr:hypothetical protein BMS3Bbin02_01038 [bacterium BMS3Bbin02]
MELILKHAQFVAATHKRGFAQIATTPSARASNHPQRLERRYRDLLTLDGVLPEARELDDTPHQVTSRLTDQHGTGWRQ